MGVELNCCILDLINIHDDLFLLCMHKEFGYLIFETKQVDPLIITNLPDSFFSFFSNNRFDFLSLKRNRVFLNQKRNRAFWMALLFSNFCAETFSTSSLLTSSAILVISFSAAALIPCRTKSSSASYALLLFLLPIFIEENRGLGKNRAKTPKQS